ncbi:histidine kinase dimerization/phosphoacceptor domain -containing protein [Novosphingobium sp. M1R2S20]|uniref:histidine kinase n=1 Tax=Novosphingobium rhizovicinum TaxID=3228928 RepID=A0ABV3RB19_9SPHN
MTSQQHAITPSGESGVDLALSRHRLALVAQAAEQLLAAVDPARMVDDLFELIQSELQLDVFFNYRFADDRLVLEAHGGLTDEQAAAGAELQLGQAVCGCAARNRERLHVTEVQGSDDPLVAFVKGIGLDAYACTPLVHGEKLIGTLGFGRKWASKFTEDELSFLHTLCHYVTLAKVRLQAEEELRAGIAARERLLSELNHRVRNALQLVVSMVRLETADEAEPGRAAALSRMGDRIEVIASAHRPLYASKDLSSVSIVDLLKGLGGDRPAESVRVVGTVTTRLPIEKAVALALLVDTALNHASQSEGGFSIEIASGGTGDIAEIAVKDANLPDNVFEQRLSRAFLRQVGATHSVSGGTLTIRFPARV